MDSVYQEALDRVRRVMASPGKAIVAEVYYTDEDGDWDTYKMPAELLIDLGIIAKQAAGLSVAPDPVSKSPE